MKTKHWIILFFLLGTLSLTWFKKDLILSGGDFPFNFSPKTSFSDYYSVWNSSISLGLSNVQAIPHLFYQSIYYLVALVGVPLWLVQRIIYYLIFSIGGIGTYLLIKKISGLPDIFCFLGGVFYMLNPFSLVFVWGILSLLVFAYAAFPFMLYIFAVGLEKRRAGDILAFCLVGLLFSAFYGNFSFVIVLWGTMLLLLFTNIISKKNTVEKIIFFMLLVLFWVLTNFYWFFPYFSGIKALAKDTVYQDSTEILLGSTAKAAPYNTFRLMGYSVFFEKFMGIDDFYPYADRYKSTFIIIISFFIPFLVFLGILLKPNRNRNLNFFILLFLASVFVYKGFRPPFGQLYLNLIEDVPLAASFRSPLDKIGPALVLSCAGLIAYCFYFIQSKFNNRKKIGYFVNGTISFFLFIVLVFPFWQRRVFYSGGKVRPSILTKLPFYYYEMANWLKEQPEEFRILPIPLGNLFGTPYDWEFGHGGSDPLVFVLGKPLVYYDKEIVDLVNSCLIGTSTEKEESTDCLIPLLKLLNVKYLLVHNDVDRNFFNVNSDQLNSIQLKLKKNYFDGVRFEKSFGEVDLYRFSTEYFVPKFYFPQKVYFVSIDKPGSWKKAIFSEKEISSQAFFVNTMDFPDNSSLISDWVRRNIVEEKSVMYEDKPSVHFIASMVSVPPKATLIKKGPGYFLLSVENVERENVFVFSENNDENWKAYLGGKELRHMRVNGFANAWWIENIPSGEKLMVEVKYLPQTKFMIGLMVSIFSYLLLALVVYARNKAN